jgi:hypothetical protein
MTALTIIDSEGKSRQVLRPISNNVLTLLLPGERLCVGIIDALRARRTCLDCMGSGLRIDNSICECNGTGRAHAK